MANTRARRRRRRRTNWQAAFWMLIIGIVIGIVLGVWLCANYGLLDVIGQTADGQIKEQQVVKAYLPMSDEDEQEETPKPAITPKVVMPTPKPEEPTPEPAEPTEEPVVTPEPVEPTPEPVVAADPVTEPEPTAVPAEESAAEENGFGLASSFEGDAEVADEEPDPVMTDENGNPITQEQYEAANGAAEETVDEEPAEEQTAAPEAEQTTNVAVNTQPRPRTDPVQPQEWFVFETEIDAEGMPYYGNDGAGTVVPMAIRVADYMSPDDYAAQYADQYQLYGVEAAVVIEIRNDSASAVIVPDNALGIVLRDKADIPNDTYPLADAPMKASTDITVGPGETVTVYKRYALNAAEGPYPFLSMAYMVGGETCRTYFLLEGME